MTIISRLSREIIAKVKNKITPEAFNQRNTQKTIETVTGYQESFDSFERVSSNDTLVDISLDLHTEAEESCEQFVDEYAYSETYEKEHAPEIPREVLNIIA